MDDMLGEDKFRAEQNLLAMEEDEAI